MPLAACRLHASGVVAAYDTLAARRDKAPVTTPSGERFDADSLSDAIDAYLFELRLPAKGATCAAKPVVFGPAAAHAAQQGSPEQAALRDSRLPTMRR